MATVSKVLTQDQASELNDPQDEMLLDDVSKSQLGSRLSSPCYAFQTNGPHLRNVESMRHRLYRAVEKWINSGKGIPVPTHFLCHHCDQRHLIDLDGVNRILFEDPFPLDRSAIYDDLLARIHGTPSAGSPDFRYNSFPSEKDFDIWRDLISYDKPTPKAAK